MTIRLGIDLGGTKIEGVAIEPNGEIRCRHRVATPKGDYHGTIDAILRLLDHLERDLPPTRADPRPVGIGIPGSKSEVTGRIKNANSIWLIDKPFEEDLKQALKRPVRLANDANCFAISEARDGAAAGYSMVFGVILGTGVGGGIAMNGRVWKGPNAIAGEWGHNPLPWPKDDERPGPLCYCGKYGCLETFLSGPGLSADYAQLGGTELPADEIFTQASGNAIAGLAASRYLDRLARGLANVINMLDPDCIVLGGGLSNISQLYENTPKALSDYVFSDHVTTPIVKNKHGDSSGVRGAAWLWSLEELSGTPIS